MFDPIAIIGRACLLPGAHNPDQLWQLIDKQRTAITAAPQFRWRASRERALAEGLCVSDAGGFVDDAHVRGQAGDGQDPLVDWLFHVGHAALVDAEIVDSELKQRAGAIIGNLAYPTESLVDLAQSLYVPEAETPRRHPLTRFSAGLPVHLLCRELGLTAGGYAIDAACASSLYAMKIACDWLHSNRADVMLAGGINRVEGLLIHAGFTALRALSPTGRSRPFHRDADGLVPAEGAAMVVLKRLSDAEKAGNRILGVIRGIGLSNDGRGSGLLSPSSSGQVRAMRAAYVQSELRPSDISLVECHATGTSVGDSVELQSMSEVFAGCDGLPIGSLKSNLGHLITASGAAGVIKILEAMKSNTLPATVNSTPLTTGLDGTPFRVLSAGEPWQTKGALKRAAVSSFGFGGNNAHLILEEYRPGNFQVCSFSSPSSRVAVVGLAARLGSGVTTAQFESDFIEGMSRICRLEDGGLGAAAKEIQLPNSGLIFPPKDLQRSLAQQNLLLELADEALNQVATVRGERISAFVGMGCDPESARTVLQAALPDLLAKADLSPAAISQRQKAMDAGFDAARVVGCMPNIPANRLNRQFDLQGPSFTVAAEELSGIRALEIAADALASNEIDVALAGAADFCVEPVHRFASTELQESQKIPGDGGCVFVLKRVEDAVRDGDSIRAILEIGDIGDKGQPELSQSLTKRVEKCFGHVHAASGLIETAAAIVSVDRGVNFDQDRAQPVIPNSQPRQLHVQVEALGGLSTFVTVTQHASTTARPSPPSVNPSTPDIYLYAAPNLEALKTNIELDRRATDTASGPYRVALVTTSDEHSRRLREAREMLERTANRPAGEVVPEDGIFFRQKPMLGEIGFVFTGASAAYREAGRDLLLAFPDLIPSDSKAEWVYADDTRTPTDFDRLCGSSLLCQVHAKFSQQILHLNPHAAIGLSSGETNALYALGAWHGMQDLLHDIEQAGLYTTVLGGEALAVKEYWNRAGITGSSWATYWIAVPFDEVQAVLGNDEGVHITIVNSPDDVVIAGDADACRRVFERMGSRGALLGGDFAAHCAAVEPAAALWRSLHHRPTTPQKNIRFYSNALGHAYDLTADTVADALTAQALHTVDFPRTIRRAWDDGVRIFVEHGPRSQCTQSIRRILGDLPHLAVSLDVVSRPSLTQALYTAAELWTAGVPVDIKNLRSRVIGDDVRHEPPRQFLRLPAHPATPDVVVMVPAPPLAPVSRQDIPKVEPAVQTGTVKAPAAASRTAAAVALHAQMSMAHQEHVQQMARLDMAFQQMQTRVLQAFNRPLAVELPKPRRSFSRRDLEIHASGRVSEIFGPLFESQDEYARQVRMPEPPLLLADRVIDLVGEPGSMGLGSITTETDVKADAWYLHSGRMSAGVMIESGQADLMLISWLGVDKLNKGNRVYRLLGCDLSFSGSLPRVGETLRFDIHVDGHASHSAVRIFFFHYECTSAGVTRLTVRNGQAGFFSDEELANSEGILWSPETGTHTAPDTARVEIPAKSTKIRSFDSTRVRAFADGRPADCFGDGFDGTYTHTATPRIQAERMQLLQSVPVFDPQGGPWKRGYLRAEWNIRPNDWFFEGHFKNDQCMPGTLMFEGCLQAMAFYLAALGFTTDHDGWRFEPVPDEFYSLRCRGQVLPTSRLLVYEVFVDEIIAAPTPTIYADVLCSVDGLKAFHCARLGLRLTPHWPLDEVQSKQSANIPFDYESLMACALGKPSNAFGSSFSRFDGPIRVPRLPGPPYHFMSRVTRVEGQGTAGAAAEVEYDIPSDAWYFTENGYPVMPISVLTEVLLQPCGWLASFAGTWKQVRHDIFFRNLDGSGTVHSEVRREDQRLRTRVTLKSCSEMGSMSITSFEITCHAGDRPVFDGQAVFGHFPAESLRNQTGLQAAADEVQWMSAEAPATIDITELGSGIRLGRDKLRMIDRITGYWPDGGAAKLGRVRAEFNVDPRQWFFKAHFFGDPVQPGSLGMEAIVQTLQAWMITAGCHEQLRSPRFQAVATEQNVSWTYRGQVVPQNQKVTILLEVIERRDAFAKASASLWVDGAKIYFIPAVSMRVVEAEDSTEELEELDPETDSWLNHHCPTYTIPVLPMMSIVDRLAKAAQRIAPSKRVIEVRDVVLNGWISFAHGKRRLKTETEFDGADRVKVSLSVWREAPHAALSRYDVMATALVRLADEYPEPPSSLPALTNAVRVDVPYQTGELFHGPAFHFVQSIVRSDSGSSFELDSDKGAVPRGFMNQGLFDGITHGIPNESLRLWSEAITDDQVGYPSRIVRFAFFDRPPEDGASRCEVRFLGFHNGDHRFPRFQAQLITGDRVWAELDLVYVLFSKGPLGNTSPANRKKFLSDLQYVPNVQLGRLEADALIVDPTDLYESDWLPGTIERAFGLRTTDRVRELAVKQQVAREIHVHPSRIAVLENGQCAPIAEYPLNKFPVRIELLGETIKVSKPEQSPLDITPVREFWQRVYGIRNWPISDLYVGLLERFVRRVELLDPQAFNATRCRPALFVANHQVAIESILFNVVISALSELPIKIIAKSEHRESWIGQLINWTQRYPGVQAQAPILFFDRANPRAMFEALGEYRDSLQKSPSSLMVHVDGTRALSCRTPVSQVSSVFLDLAMELDLPIIPVRFVGGLPVEPVAERLEFPFGAGQQDIRIGRPVLPSELQSLPLIERTRTIVNAINSLAPEDEKSFGSHHQHSSVGVVLLDALRACKTRCAESDMLIAALEGQNVNWASGSSTWVREFTSWCNDQTK